MSSSNFFQFWPLISVKLQFADILLLLPAQGRLLNDDAHQFFFGQLGKAFRVKLLRQVFHHHCDTLPQFPSLSIPPT